MGILAKAFPPDRPDKFAERVMAAAKAATGGADFRFDADEFALRRVDTDAVWFLHDVYRRYCAEPPGRRRRVIEQWVGSLLEIQHATDELTLETALPRLLPRLIPQGMVDASRAVAASELGGASTAGDMAVRRFSPHRALALVVDSPRAMSYCTVTQLQDWGKTFDDLLPRAMENLWAMSKQDLFSPGPGVWVSPYGDSHDASRLALDGLVFQHAVEGDHVAIPPTVADLLFTGSDDLNGLAFILEMSTKLIDAGPRPIDGRLHRLRNHVWEPWMPPLDHPARALAEEFFYTAEAQDYADQVPRLEAEVSRLGKDVYVAPYDALRDERGRVSAVTVWTEGVPTLLPEAPSVGFVRDEQSPAVKGGADPIVGRFPWADVVRVCGPLMRAQKTRPPRYFVMAFPTDEMFERLRPHAL
jgi:hypothetical protein